MAKTQVTLSGCICYTTTMSNLQLCVLHLQYEHKGCAIPFYAQHWNGERYKLHILKRCILN